MVADEVGPLTLGWDFRQLFELPCQRPGVLAGQGEIHPLHHGEVEQHVELVAGMPPENLANGLGGRLTSPSNTAPPLRREMKPEAPEELVRVEAHILSTVLEQEGDGVDAEAVHTELHPEAAIFSISPRTTVGVVEVGLMQVEVV